MAEVAVNAHITAARVASEDPIFPAKAAAVRAALAARAAPHVKSGQYISSLHVRSQLTRRRVRDQVVYSTDPQARQIEFGHWEVRGGRNIRWIRGQFIFLGVVRTARL